ncbi:copper amine oxidase N-terminal domain-containing protein [Paenibacillus agilis]|uniref:Copper amine oxidase N-terminal domain-containing protein n=1 Tax=Paenibacillus agilis TaxID=3020863 RepID=A0A559J0G6_9BACL|nr:copper amine oxidase N-terminal domain-containing protein [Paenibacillus agilis]TVX93367.1 copper amine oxidase N-terminal domain-containing protein [Paenibacillus agilis]
MKKKFFAITAAVFVWGMISLGADVHAASESEPSVQVIIDSDWQSDFLVLQGRTLVPLVAFHDPEWVTYSYKPKTKTIRIEGSVQKIDIQLTIGSKDVLVNGSKKRLDVPVTIRDGRTYVPLRFLSDQLGGSAYYHKPSKQTIIRTPSYIEKIETLKRGSLADARQIAISLPILREKGALQPMGDGFIIDYIFPEGETMRYFREYKSLKEYIEINKQGYAEVKWATDTYVPPGTKSRERGAEPPDFGKAVYFTDNFMSELTEYGKIDSSGVSTQLGQTEQVLQKNQRRIIVPIHGEQRTDAQ